MSKKITVLGMVLVILGAIPITVYLTSIRQEIRKRAAEAVALSILPKTLQKKAGEFFDAQIFLDTKNQIIGAVETSISFDPEVLEVIDSLPVTDGSQVTPGNLFTDEVIIANSVDNLKGKIALSISTLTPFKGKGVFGSIHFRAKSGIEATEFRFDLSRTRVSQIDSRSVLVITNPALYSIAGPTVVKKEIVPAGTYPVASSSYFKPSSLVFMRSFLAPKGNSPGVGIILASGIPMLGGFGLIFWGTGVFRYLRRRI